MRVSTRFGGANICRFGGDQNRGHPTKTKVDHGAARFEGIVQTVVEKHRVIDLRWELELVPPTESATSMAVSRCCFERQQQCEKLQLYDGQTAGREKECCYLSPRLDVQQQMQKQKQKPSFQKYNSSSSKVYFKSCLERRERKRKEMGGRHCLDGKSNAKTSSTA
jgi:hypothetical protein